MSIILQKLDEPRCPVQNDVRHVPRSNGGGHAGGADVLSVDDLSRSLKPACAAFSLSRWCLSPS